MTRIQRPVHVVGVGMIPFTKPGASDPYTVMGARAAKLALEDAGVDYRLVEQAYVGYVYGDSTAGQAAIRGAHTADVIFENCRVPASRKTMNGDAAIYARIIKDANFRLNQRKRGGGPRLFAFS